MPPPEATPFPKRAALKKVAQRRRPRLPTPPPEYPGTDSDGESQPEPIDEEAPMGPQFLRHLTYVKWKHYHMKQKCNELLHHWRTQNESIQHFEMAAAVEAEKVKKLKQELRHEQVVREQLEGDMMSLMEEKEQREQLAREVAELREDGEAHKQHEACLQRMLEAETRQRETLEKTM